MVIFPKYTWLYCFSILPGKSEETGYGTSENGLGRTIPRYPLEYYHSSTLIENLYESELVQITILLVFCVLSIIIAGMGLFALSGLFMQRRVKAAALRKINGARIHQIILPELLVLPVAGAPLLRPAPSCIIVPH